jgi:tetratricopeptide (TPR) repeat protein
MTDVFVSYASEDRERVREIVDSLENTGWSIWWDRRIDAGSAYDREIERAIDEAKCIVVVWSSHSVESEWVRTEASEGLEKGNLVPVAIEDVRPPLAFRRIQTIDFNGEGALEQIRESIARLAPPASGDTVDQTPFAGRKQERERVIEMLDRIRQEEGKAVMFAGEAGVGKTRLTREISIAARQQGFLILTGHCLDMEGAPPYQPLLDQISQVARLIPPENLRTILGENAPEVAKLMPELRQQFPDIGEPAELPPDQERRYLLNGVGDFVDRGAKTQPMLLIFEDLHWADDSTCILIRHLTDRLKESPVLIIGTYRDDELDTNRPFSRALQELTRERLIDEVVLKCLDKEGVQQIIEGRARKTAPAELVELVFSETEGNPFFVEEVLRHLEEEGKLFDDKGDFTSGVEIKDTEVPRSLRLVIGERLARVSDTCRTVLTAAAVAGRTFGFELLLAVNAKFDEDDVLDALEEAEAASLVEDMSRDREARYGFVHEQIRQTLLAELSFPRRQRLHLRIGNALEELYGDRADEQAGELSYHFLRAGQAAETDRTLNYLVLAAERALDSLAFEDALKRIEAGLEFASGEAASRLHRVRGKALSGMGRIDDAMAAYDEAIAVAMNADDADAILLARCRMLLDVWRGSEAVEDLERLLEREQTQGDRPGELEARRWLARAYYVMSLDNQGWGEKALAAYDETIALARELGNDRTLGHALVSTAQFIDYDRGFLGQAEANLEEAETIAQRISDEELQIDVATARLNTVFNDARDAFGEVILDKLLSRRDPIRLNAHYFRMMWSALAAARLERCVEICDAGTELAYRIGTLPVQYPTIKAIALLELGRFDDALTAVAEEIADEDHRFGAALQKLGELQYLLDCAAFDEAFEKAPHVIEESEALSRIWMLNWVANALAHVTPYLNAADIQRARALIDSTGMRLGRAGQSSLALAEGDLDQARTLGTGERKAELEVREARRLLATRERFAQTLVAAGAWDDACAEIDQAIPACREAKLQQILWRLLALKAMVCRSRKDDAAAETARTEARALQADIATTISNPAHRECFVAGAVARQLELSS